MNAANPQRVYAAGPAGVSRSDDAGKTWALANEGVGDADIVALTLSPATSDTIYAATADGTLFRSDDGATAWRRVGQ